MPKNFLDFEDIPDSYSKKVKQDLKFRTGNFVWRVKFNTPLDPASITKDTMYITDSKGERRQALIRYDANKNQIEVEPINPYAQNEYYHLHITTKVRSKRGQYLKEPIELKFRL